MYCGDAAGSNHVCVACIHAETTLAEKYPSRERIEELRRTYKEGMVVRLVEMNDIQAPPKGTLGKVKFVDDAGQVHCTWPGGSRLALIPGVDTFAIAANEREE